MKNIFLVCLVVLSSCSGISKNKVDQEGIAIAVVNFKVLGEQDLKTHFNKIEKLTIASKKKDAKFVLLPELMILDLLPKNPAEEKMKLHLEKLASIAEVYEENLIRIATDVGINIIGASYIIKKKAHFINRAVYISDSGKVHYQDKMQPTPWESKHGFKGVKNVKTFKTKDFSFVILVCHDSEFPSISTMLKKTNPEVIFVPSQTDDIHGLRRVQYTSAARAVEHMAYVLMTGTSGNANAPWHSYVGQNFLFTPQNKYFVDEEDKGSFNKETISIFHLDINKIKKARSDGSQVYPARDMKL